ncbi:hypothetical protein LTR36_007734 [Oleoguttula mirabilis]|uniref:ABM domain-containing protein n=1 Tax=Oleoguttula mirabilis TaxID=1507867 RepID=A0AAV9JUL0_9PEZI|nr:hypothetical protein LTR36_007734 [Oleoguttula mirabilis]
MPTTEVAVFPLKAGSNPGDPDSVTAKVLKSAFDTLNTVDGMQQIQFGPRVEDPTAFVLMVNWDSKKHHEDFTATDAYGPFFKNVMSIVDGAPLMFVHADFKPEGSLSKTFSAPVTEMAVFYFEGGPPSDYLEGVEKLNKVLEEHTPEGLLSSSAGITYEDVEKDGIKGKAAIVTIGWQSIESHMAFRSSQVFKDNIHLLRSTSKKVEMNHIAFMQYLEG